MAEESHNQQMLMQQQQQSQQPQQQQPQQQTVGATMSMGNTMEQNNQMNVSNSVPLSVATINASQPQTLPNIAAAANTTSGGPVQLAVPQLTAQSQAPPPCSMSMMSQSSGQHPTMMHPTMTMAQSPLQQVQVIQQPLSTSYLQHLYTPQQQMLFPGGLTLQHAGMTTPTLQSLGATQGLSLQLQSKATLDPKNTVGGQNLQALNSANKGMAVNAGAMMTASGQVIGTAGTKATFQQQMMAAGQGKTLIHNQGFPSNANQTVVIGQLGMLPNQQSIFNHKALAESHKGKTYMMNQQATLQPKSPIYSSSLPVHSSAQVFNGNHLKQLTSQPQLITSQAPGTMFTTQAQILGSLALGASLPQGISWATTPGCLQPSALLAQNPIIIRSQESNMIFQQSPPQAAVHLPVAAATAPMPPTSFASTPLMQQKVKQVRPGSSVATQTMVSTAATVNTNTPPIRTQIKPKVRTSNPLLAPSIVPFSPQMATTQTQTNQFPAPQLQPPPISPHQHHPQQQQHHHHHQQQLHQQHHQQQLHQLQQQVPHQQKSDASNQTKSTPEMKSIATQSKSVSVEAKSPSIPVAKSQAMVAPSAKISMSVAETSMSTTTMNSTSTNTFAAEVSVATVAPTVNPVSSSTSTVSTGTDSMSNNRADGRKDMLMPQPQHPKHCSVATQDMQSMEIRKTETVKPEMVVKPALPVVKDKQPQKAIVKPQVLTHVIDGYIIQEGPEPFPVSRSSLMTDMMSSKPVPPEIPEKIQETNGSPEKKKKIHRARGNVELAKCEFCGKMGPKSKFKRSKRFCSTSCAKRYNVCFSKRVGLLPVAMQENAAPQGKGNKRKMGTRKGWRKQEGGRLAYNTSEYNEEENADDDSAIQMEEEENNQSEEMGKMEEELTESPSGSESPTLNVLPTQKEVVEMEVEHVDATAVLDTKLPNKWSVQEVFEFIRDLPGCSDYADEFRSQEIDGQALLLLKEDHLMTAMCMKLGPALKLIARINSIKEELSIS